MWQAKLLEPDKALYEERTILLMGSVDDKMAKDLVGAQQLSHVLSIFVMPPLMLSVYLCVLLLVPHTVLTLEPHLHLICV